MVYLDDGYLYVGVTYETERIFRWLRKISDANISGLAAIKVSANTQETNPSTSVIDQDLNDSRINLVYEAKDSDDSTVVFVSFNYLTGAVERMYRINKGTQNEMANKMVLQNIHGAAFMNGTATSTAS
jgi:hypothetical protein